MLKCVFLALGVAALVADSATGLTATAVINKPGVICPMYRCANPVCPSGQVVVQQSDDNGCYRCPICKPCPALPCAAPLCPKDQQTTVTLPNGCPGCPTCNTKKCNGLQHSCPCATGSYCLFAGGMCKSADSPCPNHPVCGPRQHSCPCATGNYCLAANAMCISPDSPCPSGCPKLFCPALLCPLEQQIKAVAKRNGCTGCPHCPCICGEACTMTGGGSGVCQPGGQCAVNIIKPNCPGATTCGDCGSVCKLGYGSGYCQPNGQCGLGFLKPDCPGTTCGACGSACTTNYGSGYCQEDGKCLQTTVRPVCGLPCAIACPTLYCPAEQQVPPTTNCGCHTCRICPIIDCPNLTCPVDQQVRPTGCGCTTCRIHIPILQGPLATAPPLPAPELGENFGVQAALQTGLHAGVQGGLQAGLFNAPG